MCMRNNDPWEDDWFPIQDPYAAVLDVQVEEARENMPQGPEALQVVAIRQALAQNVIGKGGF